MDIVLIALEYSNYYVGEAALKGMIYAIKLKLEFAVLNQLMNLTKAGLTEAAHASEGRNHNDVELHHANRRGSKKTLSDTETAHISPPPRKESLRSWFPFNKVYRSLVRLGTRLLILQLLPSYRQAIEHQKVRKRFSTATRMILASKI